MSKKSFYQILLLLVITGATSAVIFYSRFNLNHSSINSFKNLTGQLSHIQDVATALQGNINLPEPLRVTGQPTNVELTKGGVVLWTNQQRRLEGLSPLTTNSQLDQAASLKLQDMFAKQYFAHVSPAGLTPGDFIDQASYDYIKTGENLALGNFADDQALVQAWMDSPGHRENILTPDFTEIGVAVGKGEFEGQTTWLAVQVFGRPIADCPAVDQNLKSAIDTNQATLGDLQKQIDLLRAQLENKPKRNADQAEIDQYNALVEQYNQLAKQYNELAQQTQKIIDTYNAQIKAFNNCANT